MADQVQGMTNKGMTDRSRIARLWRDYLWPQKGRLFAAFAFMALFALATSAFMYVFSLLVGAAEDLGDGTAIERTRRYAYTILPVLLGVAALTGFSDFFQRILSNSLALNTVAKLQKQMLSAAHRADLSLFDREQTGGLISRFTYDVKVVSDTLIRVLSNLIKDLLTVIFTIGGMLWFNWQLTLVIAIFLLALWPIIELSKKMRGSAAAVQDHTGRLTGYLKESLGSAPLIRTYQLEAHEDARLGKEFDRRIELFLKLITQQAWVEPILTLLGGLVIAGVITFGVWQVTSGRTGADTIVAVLTGIMILAPRLRALGTLNNVVQEGLSALTRVFDIIDTKAGISDTPNSIKINRLEGNVKFSDVRFTYPDGTPALKGLNLEAKAGETIALVGASGSGKSTVLKLIPRLYEIDAGKITLDDHALGDIAIKDLRANLAMVSQDVSLFHDSIAANIGLGDLSASREAIVRVAKAADAHDFISALPEGYETVLGEDGAGLSGGQRQRLSIARALLRDAPILLLDEATSALDAESEAKVQAALDRLSEGRTTIIIAHRLSTVQKADRIYVMEDGEVVEEGSWTKLSKTKDGVFAKLRALQLR